MGYRYGEHKYSEGLYSRWPDWWHIDNCLKEGWAAQDCLPPTWSTVEKAPVFVIPATPELETWAVVGADTAPWVPSPPGSLRPNPARTGGKRLPGGYRG